MSIRMAKACIMEVISPTLYAASSYASRQVRACSKHICPCVLMTGGRSSYKNVDGGREGHGSRKGDAGYQENGDLGAWS